MTTGSGADGVTITFVLNLKAEAVAMMSGGFAASLPETREFPGCRSVHAYRSTEAANRLILIEHWDSREDYEKYLAWRAESGMLDALRDAQEVPSSPEYWTLVV